MGDLCQNCQTNCLPLDNTKYEGKVDVASGEGVQCSC